ncbi:MAG: hypothetical protein WCA44_06040 [Acidobacteriaceae bacterium]
MSRKVPADWEIYEDIHGRYMRIALTQGQYALVDEWHYDRLNAFNWHAHFDPHTKSFYAVRRASDGKRKQIAIQMHRSIALNADNKDHKDGNGLNNREHNLRPASPSQNACNRKTRCTSKTGYKGVTCRTGVEGYLVRITVRGKTMALGRTKTAKEGAALYNAAALHYHGEFARLNAL